MFSYVVRVMSLSFLFVFFGLIFFFSLFSSSSSPTFFMYFDVLSYVVVILWSDVVLSCYCLISFVLYTFLLQQKRTQGKDIW